MLKGQRRTNNASPSSWWDLIQGMVYGQEQRPGCSDLQPLYHPGRLCARSRGQAKINFLLLKGLLPGISAAAFKKDANEQVWIPMMSRACDSLQVMGILLWRAVAPAPGNQCLPGALQAWVVFMHSWNHCAGDTHTICSGWLVKVIFCF